MSQVGQYLFIGGAGPVDVINGNAGVATPAAGVINIVGGSNVLTTGAGNTLTIDVINSPTVTGTLTALTLATSTATNNLQINGNTITAAGSNADVNIALVAKGAGTINMTTPSGGLVFRGIAAGFVSTEWHTLQATAQTFNAVPTVIASIVVPLRHMVSITAVINGFQSDFTDCVGGTITVTAYRTVAGNVTLVGAPIINVNYTDIIDTSDIDAAIDVGTQTIRLLVVGVAAQTWNWVTTYSYMFTIDNA